jgi:hypothetical protein
MACTMTTILYLYPKLHLSQDHVHNLTLNFVSLKPKNFDTNLSQYHFVYDKSHLDWSKIKLEPPHSKTSN